MIANTAFLAAITMFLALSWLAGELTYLAPYKAELFRRHGLSIGIATFVVFLTMCAAYYSVARRLLLRDAGRKLLHIDRQLGTRSSILDELRDQRPL
jgi:hypothetical protein